MMFSDGGWVELRTKPTFGCNAWEEAEGPLLEYARLRRVELGYQGRLALHSLPQAEGCYQRLLLPDYGPDPEKDDLIYFEYGILEL
ncbi:MAG: hypothetical protein AAGF98_13190 [Cyanobacteria bacterium P01_H01_bin.153]